MRREVPAVIVRDWQEAVNREDVDRLLELSSPDIAISGPRGSGYGHGHELLVGWVSRAGLRLETMRTFARGDVVVAAQRGVWTSRETGEITGEADLATRFLVEDGRVARLARHDGPDALAAALEEAGLDQEDEIK